MPDLVSSSIRDGIGHIRMCRTESLNALSEPLKAELINAFESMSTDDGVHVILLSGEGRAFCVGADKQGFANINEADRREVISSLELGERLIRTMLDCNAIIVAAVHGYCIGGGLSMALAADVSVCTDETVFFAPEIDLGLPYLWGSTALLYATVGRQHGNRLVYSCNRVSATQAMAMGLVADAVPPTDLEEQAWSVARHLAAKPTHALLAQKRLANRYTDALIATTGAEIDEGLHCMEIMHPEVMAR